MVSDGIRQWIQTKLFDEVPMSICVIDRDFRITQANSRFRQTYGPWKGRRCHAVYKGRPTPCARCAAVETFSDGQVRIREEEGRVRNGRPGHYLVHIVPVHRPGRAIRHVIEMSTDITRVKQLEQGKREADRLAAVGETVAGIAHGIKNVLMGLEGGMYVFKTGLEQGREERIAQGWEMVEENIKRISRFVKEFLEFARGRTPEVAPVDPNRPARRVADLFREKAAQAGVALETNLQPGIPDAPLDEEGIHACLANLVSNAIYACSVSDRTRPSRVTLSTRDRDGRLVYEVVDTGCGMDYDISRKVFSSFFSTKKTGEGTGLGLLTTRKIVHLHGGKVSFETEPGKGSVFRIELPRSGLPGLKEPADGGETPAVVGPS